MQVSSLRQNAAIIWHDIRFFIDHAKNQLGVASSILTEDPASLRQNLLEQRIVSLIQVYEIYRAAKGQSKVFNEENSCLSSKRGRS